MYFSIIRIIMGDKLKIKLSVANRIYPLTIDPSQEEGLRLASQQINTLIKKFEQNYSVRDKQDALAMCALQIASSKKQNSLNEETFINDVEDRLSNLINILDEKKLNIQKKGLTSRFEIMLEEQSMLYTIILVVFSIVFSLISNWLFRRR